MRSWEKAFKGAGVSAGHIPRTQEQVIPKTLEVKQVMQKAGLDDQGSSFVAKARKQGVWPMEAKSGDTGGIQKCCCHCGEKIHVARTQLGLMQARNRLFIVPSGDYKKLC